MSIKTAWEKSRVTVLVLTALMATFLIGRNLGFRNGIEVKYGGPGSYKTAIVEWLDTNERKVVVYLNDGANGYAFWLRMAPQYQNYSCSTKVFVARNDRDYSIKNAMENARDWCKNDWDGGASKISSGEWKPRADADAEEADRKTVPVGSNEYLELLAGREELTKLRKDVADLTLERDRLKKR